MQDNTRIVIMTNQPPVRIKDEDWKKVSESKVSIYGGPEVVFMIVYKNIRQEIAKYLVAGQATTATYTEYAGSFANDGNIISTIRQVAFDLMRQQNEVTHRLGQLCIAGLPPEDA